MTDYAKVARDYARAVVRRKGLACEYVRHQCRHHLGELKAHRQADHPYFFDAEHANLVCGFVEGLPHISGKWARQPDRRIKLEPWQLFLLCMLFGWKRKRNGLRKYREAYVELPRKQGKSTLAAAIGLYMTAADGEHGAQVFSGANTEHQAHEVFRPAKLMADSAEGRAFRDAFGVTVMAKRIMAPATASFFATLVGIPGEGQSPHLAIVDEYHEADSPEQYLAMQTGMAAREQPLMLVITTAGDDVGSPCYEMRGRAIEVLEGVAQDDQLFSLIYTIDKGDDWRNFRVWAKANPNLGISVSEDFLRAQHQKAMTRASEQNRLKSRHLNVWGGARTALFDMARWTSLARPEMAIEDFYGQEALVACDLATKIDVASVVTMFRDTEAGQPHYYPFHHGYIPRARANDPRHMRYAGWVKDGWLTAHEGEEIDLRLIRDDLLELAEAVVVSEFAFDQFRAAIQIAHELQDVGFEVVQFNIQVRLMSLPTKELIEAIAGNRIHHDGDPVLAWMLNNVTGRYDRKDNVFPNKEKAENKIDGAIALIMAIGRAMELGMNPRQSQRSVYEDQDLFLI